MVIDVDYRGSAGYGRDWRTAVYQHMGGKDLGRHRGRRPLPGIAARSRPPQQIGLYGGSYGGLHHPDGHVHAADVFAAGRRPAPGLGLGAHNTATSSESERPAGPIRKPTCKSSPISFAQGLKGALLITAHGMVDTTIEFQDNRAAGQKLIELRRRTANWRSQRPWRTTLSWSRPVGPDEYTAHPGALREEPEETVARHGV